MTEITQTKQPKAGQIFYAIWGYDQTNYDFVIIKDITKSGKSAICHVCTEEIISDISPSYGKKIIPTGKMIGQEFLLRIEGENLRGSYIYCGDRKGENNQNMRLATLYPVKEGQIFIETER